MSKKNPDPEPQPDPNAPPARPHPVTGAVPVGPDHKSYTVEEGGSGPADSGGPDTPGAHVDPTKFDPANPGKPI